MEKTRILGFLNGYFINLRQLGTQFRILASHNFFDSSYESRPFANKQTAMHLRPTNALKRRTDLSLASNWHIDDIEDWVTFFPPQKRARRVSSSTSSKSVRFANEDEVQYLHYSKEEFAGGWYTSSDSQDFRMECRQTVAFIAKSNGDTSCLDQERYCVRGLEEHISASLLCQSSPQRDIVRQVVRVQHQDQRAVRDAYLKLSQKHRCRALRRAIGDAQSSGAAHFLVGPT